MEADGIKELNPSYICADIVISKAENELDRDGGIMYSASEVLSYLKKKYIHHN